jgi:hypothetical protein
VLVADAASSSYSGLGGRFSLMAAVEPQKNIKQTAGLN